MFSCLDSVDWMLKTHAHMPPYQCELCGKAFQQQCSLSAHKGLHKGNTCCPICHTVLSRKSHLWRHLRMVHRHQIILFSGATVNAKNVYLCHRILEKDYIYIHTYRQICTIYICVHYKYTDQRLSKYRLARNTTPVILV